MSQFLLPLSQLGRHDTPGCLGCWWKITWPATQLSNPIAYHLLVLNTGNGWEWVNGMILKNYHLIIMDPSLIPDRTSKIMVFHHLPHQELTSGDLQVGSLSLAA